MSTPVKNILFLGDSLTAGYGLHHPERDSFPGRIQQKINHAGLSYHVINAGISGDTSGGGLARLDYWLSRPIDVFVLELGINDIMRGVQPSTTFHNLDAIIHRVKTKYPSVKIALMGMDFELPFSHALITEFRSIFRRLTDKHRITLVPFFLDGVMGQPTLNLPDGLHPSAKGYEVIAEKIWPVLSALL